MRASRLLLIPGVLLLAGCGSTGSRAEHGPQQPGALAGAAALAPTPVPPGFATVKSVKGPGRSIYSFDVTFEEVGLTPGETIEYRATSRAVLTYYCGGPAQTQTASLVSTQRFGADATGRVSGRISAEMSPPACPDGRPIHPGTFHLDPGELADTVHGATAQLPGSDGIFD